MYIDIEVQARRRTNAKWRKQFGERLKEFVEFISHDANVMCDVREVVFDNTPPDDDRFDWVIRLRGPGGDDIDDPNLEIKWLRLIGHWIANKAYCEPGRMEISFSVGMGSMYVSC